MRDAGGCWVGLGLQRDRGRETRDETDRILGVVRWCVDTEAMYARTDPCMYRSSYMHACKRERLWGVWGGLDILESDER